MIFVVLVCGILRDFSDNILSDACEKIKAAEEYCKTRFSRNVRKGNQAETNFPCHREKCDVCLAACHLILALYRTVDLFA